jgi:hypothetical protein
MVWGGGGGGREVVFGGGGGIGSGGGGIGSGSGGGGIGSGGGGIGSGSGGGGIGSGGGGIGSGGGGTGSGSGGGGTGSDGGFTTTFGGSFGVSKGGGPIAHHITPTNTAKTAKPPTSQRIPVRFLAGVGVAVAVVDTGGSVLSNPASVEFCVSGLEVRNCAPQRGQDFLVHVPRLEPHEVQYIFCFAGF